MKQKTAFAVLLLISASMLLLPGCPGKKEAEYSVDSLAISSQEHVFSKSYDLFVRLGEGSFNSSATLLILQNGNPMASIPLNFTESPPNGELSIRFEAAALGEQEISARIEDGGGNLVSNERSLLINVVPLGFYDFADESKSYQVEPTVWCAQEFTLENNATLSKAGLHLRSLVPSRAGKKLILQVRTDSGGFPGQGESSIILNSTIDSGLLGTVASWQEFTLPGDAFPAGTYWLVLYREDTVGNAAWTYSDESSGSRAFCRDFSNGGNWTQVEGEFAFRLE